VRRDKKSCKDQKTSTQIESHVSESSKQDSGDRSVNAEEEELRDSSNKEEDHDNRDNSDCRKRASYDETINAITSVLPEVLKKT
jgi:hypothetical protein